MILWCLLLLIFHGFSGKHVIYISSVEEHRYLTLQLKSMSSIQIYSLPMIKNRQDTYTLTFGCFENVVTLSLLSCGSQRARAVEKRVSRVKK